MRKIRLLKAGFTLIEVIIVALIILMMAIIAIPAFSKMGDKSAFDEKVTEISELIRQTQLLSINSEQGVNQYLIFINLGNSSIDLYKNDLSATNLVKRANIPSGYNVVASNKIGTNFENILVCSVALKYCCPTTDLSTACPAATIGGKTFDFMMLANPDLDSNTSPKTITIKHNPFRVEAHL